MNRQKIFKLTLRQKLGLIWPYARSRLKGQARAVLPIVAYLVLFQIFVLGIPIINAAVIAAGLIAVVAGLALFLEGLFVGIMPVGESIGLSLPRKRGLAFMLVFAFVLGVGATFAEPAISALKILGKDVKPWDAPLLFLLLNKETNWLVSAVAVGVGLAVMLGVVRFLYKWPIKPFIYASMAVLATLTGAAFFDANFAKLIGLAWDCGAVTTGPVTVPLVLALGMGVNRFVLGRDAESGGFGVVTLASLLPIMAVLGLGIMKAADAPSPMSEAKFLSPAMREASERLFDSPQALACYAFLKGTPDGVNAFFGHDAEARLEFIRRAAKDPDFRRSIFGDMSPQFRRWVAEHGTAAEKEAVFGSTDAALEEFVAAGAKTEFLPSEAQILENLTQAGQAILPLAAFLLLILKFGLKERLRRRDEVIFGIAAAMLGLAVFYIGIDAGLAGLGGQVGRMLPASFTVVPIEEKREIIRHFAPELVQKGVQDGRIVEFFHKLERHGVEEVPFESEHYNPDEQIYMHTPQVGPLFGPDRRFLGELIVLVFGLLMGYGATLAEPSLNVLAMKVEEITVGTVRRDFLVKAVAVGVGAGVALGLAKIMWDLPLAWMLAAAYAPILVLTAFAGEEYVCIGWDSAGVTTGPVTVPLVMAVGLGIGGRTGMAEGFGILAMASACPIMAVLIVGVYGAWRAKRLVSQEKLQYEGAGA